MKRTPLHRHTELQRRGYLRSVNQERKAKRREAGEVYGPGYVWMTSQPCALSGRGKCHMAQHRSPEAHHVRSVGAGGHDEQNVVPICHGHHDQVHSFGRETFERRHGVDLHASAVRWWARYLNANGLEAP